MKNNLRTFIKAFMLTVFAAILASCSGKLTPLSPSLFDVSPSPMEVRGSKIPIIVNGKFPNKWFNKNAVVTLTPVLKWQGGEQKGNSVMYQGENVSGNGTVISQNIGGAFNLKSEFDYKPNMVDPQLFLRFSSKIKNKTINLPDLKIAQGLLTTAALADAFSTNPAEAPDDFQRIIKNTYDANILFLIQQAQLRSSELNSSNMAAWRKLVKDADRNAKQNVNVEVLAYASPDGGYTLNEKLAAQREKNTTAYLNKEFSKENVGTDVYANYTAQDWDGFKKLVEASSLQDKDLVLRVLSMYKDPVEREREIKNISFVYKEVAETILPQLRRSRLIANIETIGKSDGELIQTYHANPSSLTANELLYTATLDGVQSDEVYKYVTQKYPNDYRAWSNLGAYFFASGQTEQARELFVKAGQLKSNAAEPNMNLGLLAIADNDIVKAESLIGQSSKANTANEALGLLYLKKGDYNKAVQSFGDTHTNNAALAQILAKNYNRAEEILNNIPSKNGITHYLAAITSARTNNASGVATHLKEAFAIEPSLQNYAKSDLEFAKFVTNSMVSVLLK